LNEIKEARKSTGLPLRRQHKSEIVVVFDTEDTRMAKAFTASADLKEAVRKAGVLDTPTICFLESID
jgi:hypothetical protein